MTSALPGQSRAGPSDRSQRARVLTAAVLVTALVAAVAAVIAPSGLPSDDPLGGLARFGLAVTVFAFAQLAQLQFRAAAGAVSLTWGEAALVICLHQVPAGWIPAATLLGAGLAWSGMSLLGTRRRPLEIARVASSLTVATALAGFVTTLLGQPLLATPTPPLVLAMLAGAVTYLLVSVGLGAVTLSLHHGVPTGVLLREVLRGKLLMFVGNVVVGLVVVALIEVDPRWLLILPLPLWLLQQAYRHRLRVDRDRRAWRAFAEATAALDHRDERVVATAVVSDALTGLTNRTAMLSRGDQVLRQLARDRPVALLLLDINRFKEVNDTLGHAAGDQLLRLTADRLGGLARGGDLLGRLGGDEFALLLTSVPVLGDSAAPMAYTLRQAREITERLAAPTEVAGVRMSVEAAVGVVVASAGTADMAELLRRADIAMYQAKEGSGCVAAYDSARDATSTDRLALLAELREALAADDQLVLVLQPAVDLATGAPTGVEALIRWRHPRRGWLNPHEFIRPVENSEQLGTFTRYVLDKALGVAAQWARDGLDLPISVNLSARSLLDRRLPTEIADALRRHRVPARRLVLEITETVVMSELEVIDEVLGALRTMGVQLAVDDFGTGFSSLTFLTRVAVDELKVDRSFVLRMADSPEAAAIVRTTVGLGQQLGLRVVAEGVETAEQRSALAELGCTAAQGYHFFKPMPADKIGAVLGGLVNGARSRVVPLRADGAS